MHSPDGITKNCMISFFAAVGSDNTAQIVEFTTLLTLIVTDVSS